MKTAPPMNTPIFFTLIAGPAQLGVSGVHVHPLFFLGEGNKKLPNSALQKGLFSIVHPLKLAPCAGPGPVYFSPNCLQDLEINRQI